MPQAPGPIRTQTINTLAQLWLQVLFVVLPLVIVATLFAAFPHRADDWHRSYDVPMYIGLCLGMFVCWILLLLRRFTQYVLTLILVISGGFLLIKLALLVTVAPARYMVPEIGESFFWLLPILIFSLLNHNSQLHRRLATGLLSGIGLLSLLHVALHLQVPAALTSILILFQVNMAGWVTLLGAVAYMRQHDVYLKQIAQQDTLEEMAYTDQLTGLPNRMYLERYLQRHLSDSEPRPLALLFVDIDSFKVVNDTLGHAKGDEVLRRVANVLREVAGQDMLVTRLSGDEFVLALPGTSGQEAEALGRRIQQHLQLRRDARSTDPAAGRAEEQFRVTLSIGVSVYPDDALNAEELLRHADSAMYAVKRGGKQNVRRYDSASDARTEHQQTMARALSGALQRGELSLDYQPLFDLHSGELVKVEALMRWHHPKLGLVPPTRFLPVAEQTGLIGPLGLWALREACEQAQAWRGVTLCVNLSALQLMQHDFVQELGRTLQGSGLRPEHLECELADALLMHYDARIYNVLDALKTLGVRLSIDEFGISSANLLRLHSLPVQGVKIDRACTADLTGLPIARRYACQLVQSVVQIGVSSDLGVTICGIETPQQLEIVRSMGCQTGQGYLLSPPVSAEQIGALLSGAERPTWASYLPS